MNLSAHIVVPAFAAATACLIAGVTVIWRALRRSRQQDPHEMERLRRLELNRRGRIVAGEIVDLVEPEAAAASADLHRPVMVVYKYQVAGVTYEGSQDVSALPSALGRAGFPGREFSSVKYDPKAPTNSIIAREEWSGI
jgi:hypothetical protein